MAICAVAIDRARRAIRLEAVAVHAGVAAVAGGAIRLVGVRADTRGVVARADDVALVEGGAGHADAVIDAGADATGADVADRVGFPSLQAEPSTLLGFEQEPVAWSQVPTWHWSLAVQVTPTQ